MSDKLTFQFNSKAVLAQLGNSVIEMPSLAVTGNKLRSENPDSQESKDKKFYKFIELVEAMRLHIEQLQRDIDELEACFRERDGGEWREKLALKILDADDVPQRRSDESIDDYRERLEPILIKQMLNRDGSIKARYLKDAELRDYAQWAQKQNHLNIAQGYVYELEDPNTPLERKGDIYEKLEQDGDIEEIALAAFEAKNQSAIQNQLKNISDEASDNIANTKLSTKAGLNFTS